jgi:transcriptional regulator with GAF, ATPase, and Fis domain
MAYLVTRAGDKLRDVYRLVQGETITIGRTPTNHIVVKDERCSRSHAEVFFSGNGWIFRDLDSRNGSYIDGQLLQDDHALQLDDIIRIGEVHLQFVHDVSNIFSDARMGNGGSSSEETQSKDGEIKDADVLTEWEASQITHRTLQTKFLAAAPGTDDSVSITKVGRAATVLCRLAFELAKAIDLNQLCELTLSGLFEETHVEAGALLLVPNEDIENPSGSDLELVAAKTTPDEVYHRISDFLATTVLREGEAIMAQNTSEDSMLGGRDSHGEIHATSVMCAPIRGSDQILGLVHLYSTHADLVPDPDDLEFTLAVAETVGVALENFRRHDALADNLNQIHVENIQLRERLSVESEVVGNSASMEKISQEVLRAAPSRATILIRGESGVGKELVARSVHYASPRSKGPFVCLNCAALTETLLESELFGHEKGAFTGATSRKIGKFEAAHSGTLMLDEIGEMSPTIQAKFLRVLEGHPFERVGGSEPISADVRVIAATNRDLEKDVSEGVFRRDLYFRLHVVEILVPALRKRPDDIPLLADHFLRKYNQETGRRIRGFTSDAVEALSNYRWPGNVRELKNVIERAVVLSRSDYLDLEDLTLSNLTTATDSVHIMPVAPDSEPMSLSEMERRHVLAMLQSTGWNKSRTASILGIERSTLDRKIRRYDLVEEFPSNRR